MKSFKIHPGFETFLAEISAEFINLPSDRVVEKIEDALRELVEFMGADRSTLGEKFSHGSELHVICSYAVPGIEKLSPGRIDLLLPWTTEKMTRGEIVFYSSLDELPAEAETDKQTFIKLKQKSNIIVPIFVGESMKYALAIGTVRSERVWPEEFIPRLRLLGEILCNALIRKQTDEQLRASEESFAAIFENAPVAMLLMDRDRRIHKINRKAGEIFSITESFSDKPYFGEAVRCIHRGDNPESSGCGDFCRTSCLMRRIVEETYETGESRYQIEANLISEDGAEEDELFLLVSTVFIERSGDQELLVSVKDITGQKQAERRSLELRQELLHVERNSSMGELAAAIAHEIKQPLTAILSNARAAQRFLAPDHQDLDEVREALSDIAEDSSRADQIILRLRSLMRKSGMKLLPLDLNIIVEEIVTLLRGMIAIKGAAIHLDLGENLPSIMADRIQIQQVILNLILNCLDAGGREIVISTTEVEPGMIRLAARDDGKGITEDILSRIFDPYLTTKEDGMGMGLAICRTIINAHGGSIQAENNPDRGATIYFLLPGGDK